MNARLRSLLAHLTLTVASVGAVGPVLWLLHLAFDTGDGNFGLKHFVHVVGTRTPQGTSLFGAQLLGSIVVSSVTTLVGIALATPAAYALSRLRFGGRRASLAAFLVTQLFPATLLMIPVYVLLDELRLLGAWTGLVFAYSTVTLPFCVFMLRGWFDAIPRELEEAARVDGASQARIFFRLVLPMMRPAIVVTALFSFMSAWNEFILASTFLIGPQNLTLPVALRAYVVAKPSDWSAFAAGAVLVSAPVMVLFFFLERHLARGLARSGQEVR